MNNQIREIKEPDHNLTCIFCQRYETNTVEWGPMYQLGEVTVHYFCLLFSAGLIQGGDDEEGIWGFLTPDILKEVKRGDKLKCKYCKKYRATVGCIIKNCKYSFHYTCGLEHGTLHQFFGSFSSYCPSHKPRQMIPGEAEWQCPICFVEVESDKEAVWPPCCGKKVFHRSCLMHTAKEAGYFFKCPLCNNATDKFLLAMKANGVFVPEQDAAWEREPNAFAELTEQYARCDAQNCLCPDGRETDRKDDLKWKIVRCGGCGASATHAKCSGILGALTWKCTTCTTVLLDNSGVNTSSLVSSSSMRGRRARADERNLNYSDSEDQTSEGDSDLSGSTSDEEEKILKAIPNAAAIVRRISSSSDSSDSDCDSAVVPVVTAPISTSKNEETESIGGEFIYNAELKKQYRVTGKVQPPKRKRKQRTEKNDALVKKGEPSFIQDLPKEGLGSLSTAISGSDNSPASSNNRRRSGFLSGNIKNAQSRDLSSLNSRFAKLRENHPIANDNEPSLSDDGKTLGQLESIYRSMPSESSLKRRRAKARKQAETLQSVLQASNIQSIDVSKLPKIPKVAPRGPNSASNSHEPSIDVRKLPKIPKLAPGQSNSQMENRKSMLTESRVEEFPRKTFAQVRQNMNRIEPEINYNVPQPHVEEQVFNRNQPEFNNVDLPNYQTQRVQATFYTEPHHSSQSPFVPYAPIYSSQYHINPNQWTQPSGGYNPYSQGSNQFEVESYYNFDYPPRNEPQIPYEHHQLWHPFENDIQQNEQEFISQSNCRPYSSDLELTSIRRPLPPPISFYDDTPTTYVRREFNPKQYVDDSEFIQVKNELTPCSSNSFEIKNQRRYKAPSSSWVNPEERPYEVSRNIPPRNEEYELHDSFSPLEKPNRNVTSTTTTPDLDCNLKVESDFEVFDTATTTTTSAKEAKADVEIIDLDTDDEIEVVSEKVISPPIPATVKSAAFESLLNRRRACSKSPASSTTGRTVISLDSD